MNRRKTAKLFMVRMAFAIQYTPTDSFYMDLELPFATILYIPYMRVK